MSELPKGWAECRLDDISAIITGKTPSKKNAEYFGGSIPFIKPGDVNNQGFIEFTQETLTELGAKTVPIIPKNSITVTCIGNLGRVGITTKESVTNQQINTVVVNPLINYRFIYHYIRTLKHWMESEASATTVSIINKSKFSAAPVYLAPLNEQVRIADKLDSILAKVNKAQSRLDKIPTILKRFRQSVLIAATSGDLTKEWREENDITLSGWEETVFSELSREITVGFVGKMSDKYQSEGVKFLRSQNVRAFRFDSKNLLYISTEFHEKIYKSRLEAGDLAVVRSGAPGTTCVIPDDLGDANCSDLVIVRPNEKLISEFGCIYMNSSVAQKNVKDNQVGVAQQHFNVGSMKLMPISLPTKAEQSEIVRRVHSLFALAEAVEKNYKDSNVKVNRLTQSLLAKAFRGELVPQDSNDESADKLLKRIRKSVTNKPKKKPSPNIKKEKVEEVKSSDCVENSSKANLTSEASDTKDTLRAKYQAEIHKAQISLQGATFSVEQFSSLTEFKGGYVELKKLIMNLLKGVPGINEPLFEVESWDAKSGDYALRLVKS